MDENSSLLSERSLRALRRQRNAAPVVPSRMRNEGQLIQRVVPQDNNDTDADNEEEDKLSLELLKEVLEHILSHELEAQLKNARIIRQIVSQIHDPPIDFVLKSGVVPRLVEFLSSESPQLQFEAACTLTNIAAGSFNQAKKVMESGAIIPMLKLFSSTDPRVVEECMCGVGNVAGNGHALADKVINCGILDILPTIINSDISISLLRKVAWIISSLCKFRNPSDPKKAMKQLLPLIQQLIEHRDLEVLKDTCWALFFLTQDTEEKIDDVLDSKILPQVVALLEKEHDELKTPTLRIIGNLVAGTEEQIQAAIDADILLHVKRLLEQEKCPARYDCAHVLANMTYSGNFEQVMVVVNGGFIPLIFAMLADQDENIVLVALEIIYNFLRKSQKMDAVDKIVLKIKEADVLEFLEMSHFPDQSEVHTRARRIMHEFFQ